MKYNYLVFIIFLISSIIRCGEKYFIPPLEGFLIEYDQNKAVKKIGWGRLGIGWFKSGFSFDLEGKFLEALKKLDPRTTPYPLTWKGHDAPYVIYQFLIDQLNPILFLNDIKQRIDNLPRGSNRNLMKEFAAMTFDPEKNTNIMCQIDKGKQLAEKAKQQGYHLYLIENWNKISFDFLKKKFHSLFSLFNDNILISGSQKEIKTVKTYQKFFKEKGIRPEDAIVIETQLHLVNALKHEFPKLTVIHCHNKNFSQIESVLRSKNIIL